jgi:hypothetical protein
LQFFVFLAFKRVEVENKEMALVAAYINKIFVDQAAEHAMARCLFHGFSLKGLRINNMELVSFATGKHKNLLRCSSIRVDSRCIRKGGELTSSRNERANPVRNARTFYYIGVFAQ